MTVPKIDIGGRSIPSGYLIGRVSPGTGRQELLAIADIGRQLVASAAVSGGSGSLPVPITGANGGTGVANTGKTITLGGNLTTSGAFATTLTVTADSDATLPAGTHTLAAPDVAQTWTATQTHTQLIDMENTNSTTGINGAGGRFRFKNTDATAGNWIRCVQPLDSGGSGLGGYYFQVLDHTNHEGDAVIAARANGAVNPAERIRATGSGNVGLAGNFATNAPQARLHVGTAAATARVYNLFTDAANGTWGYIGDWGFLSNVCTFGSDQNGTGTARDMQLVSGGVAGLRMNTSQIIGLGPSVTMAATFPALKRSSTVLEHRLADDSAYGPVAASEVRQYGGENGQFAAVKSKTELTTIAAAATTDTTITIPANALVFAVSVRVTTAIPTAVTFDWGIAGATTRYGTGVSTAANTTSPGTLDAMRYYAGATAIRITPNATPAANTGRVRITIHYIEVTPPTS